MASLIAKKKANKLYYYVVESARVDGKPRIVHQTYLGTAEKVAALVSGSRMTKRRLQAVLAAVRTPAGIEADDAEREQRVRDLTAAAEQNARALNAATLFELDDVIDPAESRRWITTMLASAPPPPPRAGKKRPCIDPW